MPGPLGSDRRLQQASFDVNPWEQLHIENNKMLSLFYPGTREQAQTLNASVIFFFKVHLWTTHTQSLCMVIQSQIFAI